MGVCRFKLYFPDSGSLKTKRQALRRIVDRVRAKFNAAVAEVGDQDSWQRAAVAIAVVGNDGRHVQSMLDRISSFIDNLYVAPVLERECELLPYSEGEPLGEL